MVGVHCEQNVEKSPTTANHNETFKPYPNRIQY